MTTIQALGEDLEEGLKKFFGFNTFRPHQKDIVQAILAGKDVLAILPTGAGKSLCYQLPAMLLPGTAIIISPLISLMQDQVESLFKSGIPAAYLNSSVHFRDVAEMLSNLSQYKMLFVAPERFTDPVFVSKLKEMPLSFFVVDEAHCISQWGHAFRPEYRQLAFLKKAFNRPVMALTATATHDVEKDMQEQLAMENPFQVKASFDRPNLTIRVHQKADLENALAQFLEKHKNESGIIYAATRKTVDSTYLDLKAAGVNVGKYHAGMSDEERRIGQRDFIHDKVQVMVATIAFGMGIHKPDVRYIVHMDMPRTIEQYYQEIGRAGRDGLPAECLMFYATKDLMIYKSFLEELTDAELIKSMSDKTEKMYRLCISARCRRKELLTYFGERPPAEFCQACDNCIDDVEYIDGTVIAQKILSCVYRLGQRFGSKHVIDVLRGSKAQAIISRQHDKLSTYNLMGDCSEQELRFYIEQLIQMGYLQVAGGEYPILEWTETSRDVVNQNGLVKFKKKKSREAVKTTPFDPACDAILFNKLRNLRTEVAQRENVPPYLVFSDRSLSEMASKYPLDSLEFHSINGVGPTKWVKYGQEFLFLIQSYCQEKGIVRNVKAVPVRVQPLERPKLIRKGGTIEETVRLFSQGRTLEEIAAIRGLVSGTILLHLVQHIEEGNELDVQSIVPKDRLGKIQEVIKEVGSETLTPIKERLPEDFSYGEIRLACAIERKNRI